MVFAIGVSTIAVISTGQEKEEITVTEKSNEKENQPNEEVFQVSEAVVSSAAIAIVKTVPEFFELNTITKNPIVAFLLQDEFLLSYFINLFANTICTNAP